MNSVVHFEIPYDERERAVKFYKEAFDWSINPVPGMPYDICHTCEVDENKMPKKAGAINGGMFKREARESPVIVMNVSNVDDALRKAENAGGKVVMQVQDVGDMGRYAKIQDTEGNVVGLWQTKG